MKISDFLLVLFLSTSVSFGLVVSLQSFGLLGDKQRIYSVDIEKVFRAQQQLIGAAVSGDFDASLQLSKTSERVSAAIESVAGKGTLVLISPVIASQGTYDITSEVLAELSLPEPKAPIEAVLKGIKMPDPGAITEFDSQKMFEAFEEWDKKQESLEKKEKARQQIERIIP